MNKKIILTLFILSICNINTIAFSSTPDNITEINSTNYTKEYEIPSEHYNNGLNYLKASKYTEAISAFRNALREKPENKAARIQLINAYIARAQYSNNKAMDYNKTANDLRSALFYLRYYNAEPIDARYLSDVNNLEATVDNILYAINADKTAKGRCTMGRSLRAQGEFAAAATEFHKSILTDNSCQKIATANLGEIYLILNLNNQAIKYLNQAINLDPQNITLQLKLACAYEKTNKIDLAAEQYNLALENAENKEDVLSSLENIWKQKINANPSDAEAHANLGAVYQRKGNFELAQSEYEKAEKLNPSNINTRLNLGTLYQAKKEYETAISAYDTIIAVNPNFKLAYLYKAQCFAAMGNKTAAIENYKIALNLDPSNQAIKTEMEKLLEENMTPEQKLAMYYNQIQKDNNNPELAYKYAYELHKAGKLTDAIIYYNHTIELNPNNQDAYINLVQAYTQQKNYDKANSTIQKAKQLFPQNELIKKQALSLNAEITSTLYSTAAILYQEKKYLDAINTYKKISPETAESLLGIGACYQALNNNLQAAEYYSKSLQKDPNNAETAYYSGLAYANSGNFDKAKFYAQKALFIEPNNKNAKELMSYVIEQETTTKMDKAIELFENQQYTQSLNLLNTIISLNNADSTAYYYRAMIYDNQKKYQLAINDYKKAIQYNPQMLISYYSIAVDYDYLGQYADALTYHKKYLNETQKIGETNDYTRYSSSRIQDLKQYEQKSTAKN